MILNPSHQRPPIMMAALFRHHSRPCLPWLWLRSGLEAQHRGLARAAAATKAAPLSGTPNATQGSPLHQEGLPYSALAATKAHAWTSASHRNPTWPPAAEEQLVFQQAPRAAPAFPELMEPGKRAVLVCVDPDINGALAVLSWHNPTPTSSNGSSSSNSLSSGNNGGSSSSNGASSGSNGSSLGLETEPLVQTHLVEVAVHDMPITIWQMASRSKKQPDAAALLELLRHHSGLGSHPPGSIVLRAIVEHTTPQHLSGKHAWYGMGYSSGLLTGLLTSQGVPYQRVDAASWKRHLGLYRLGKEGSLALARQLFPQALDSLKRKKDHGRAEAMLIAAWGLGVRTALAPGAASSSSATDAGAAELSSSSAHSAASLQGAADVAETPGKRRRPRKAQVEAAGEGSSPVAASDQQESSSSSVGSLEATVAASPRKQRKPRKKASDGDDYGAVRAGA